MTDCAPILGNCTRKKDNTFKPDDHVAQSARIQMVTASPGASTRHATQPQTQHPYVPHAIRKSEHYASRNADRVPADTYSTAEDLHAARPERVVRFPTIKTAISSRRTASAAGDCGMGAGSLHPLLFLCVQRPTAVVG